MPREIPYIFCRYDFVRKRQALSIKEQQELLESLKAARVAYRNKEPSQDEFDTFEMTPRHFTFDGVDAFSWCVGYDIRTRTEASYDTATDLITEHFAEANGIRFTRFVAVPSLRGLAVSDQRSDIHLGGMAGISRFKAVVRSKKGNRFRVEPAGSSADIDRAFKAWRVQQFSFSVRPFNPTRRRLGGQLHDLMVKNGVMQLSGVARPSGGDAITAPKSGIVGEAIGLAEHGYGQVALKGVTSQGREAVIGKPHFSQEKEKNKKRQAAPRLIKVYILEYESSERRRVGEVVKALVEFYGNET